MTNNQLTENSVNQLLNSIRLARDNAERTDNRVDHSFYYALTIALEELQERRKAAMDSEPVAYIFKHPSGKLFWALWALTDESNKGRRDVMPVYAAPQPAPVVPLVPDDVSGPLAHAYKELTPTFMRNHIAVFERYGIAPNDSSTVIQALRIALDGIERRAAMLQSQSLHAVKTAQALGSLQKTGEVLHTNSPVIPDGLIAAVNRLLDSDGSRGCYSAIQCGDAHDEIERLLAAAPQEMKL